MPISGVHDLTCKWVCKDPRPDCEHSCWCKGANTRAELEAMPEFQDEMRIVDEIVAELIAEENP